MSTANSNSPFRRRSFITAAAVVTLIALLAVIAVLGGLLGGGSSPAAPETTPTPVISPPVAQADSDPSVCGLQQYETTSSLGTSPDNSWELVGTVAAPTAPGVGPGVIENDGFRYCYSRTAEGALFAAANAYAMGSDATLRSRAYELIAPGAGRDATRESSSSASSSGGRFQFAGFSVLGYDGEYATIDLAFNRSSDGQLISLPTKLRWVEGDWKLVATDQGQPPFSPEAIENLGGFTPWSGA